MLTSINTLNPVLAEVSSKMDTLTHRVHTIALEENYMVNNSNKIEQAIDKIANRVGLEILDNAFIGKLRHKLPAFRLGDGYNTFQIEKAKIIMSALITQYLIDSGEFTTREEMIVETIDGKKTFRKERFIVFNREVSYKDLLDGIEETAGELRTKSISSKVGSKPIKYGSLQKEHARRLHSQAFKLSDIASKELLLKGYSLTRGYQSVLSGNTSEDPILMKRRFNTYAEAIMDLQYLDKLYLTTWYDSRTRMYYDLQLEGIRPQGKLWETLMIDAHTPYLIDEDGAKELVHLIMVTLEGRMTIEEAQPLFEADKAGILEHIKNLNPAAIEYTDRETIDIFGEMLLLKKLRKAYIQYVNGEPTHYIFGKDLTNSGVGIAGNAFKSELMAHAGNYGGANYAVDSHTEFAKGYGLARNLIKTAHTGLLHGSTFKSMADELHSAIKATRASDLTKEHGLELGIEKLEEEIAHINTAFVKEAAIKSYGIEVLNIDTIASWGGSIINNNSTTLLWTMLDGWKAQSTAYMEKVKMDIYVVSSVNKSGYAKWTITSDMPLICDTKGRPVYGTEDKVTVKKRGLYARS